MRRIVAMPTHPETRAAQKTQVFGSVGHKTRLTYFINYNKRGSRGPKKESL